MSDTLPPMPEPWTAQSEIKCAACGRPYKPALVRPCIGETPQSGCECGSVSFTAMVGYDSPSPAQYTADQMRAYAAAAVAEGTERLQIELENVRAEGLLLAKSAVAVERERCAVLAIDTARAAEQKYKDDPSPVRQPYANNRLMHVGWATADAIRAG